MSNFKRYWAKNKLQILQKRKQRYLNDEEYRNRLKTKSKILASIDRLLSYRREA